MCDADLQRKYCLPPVFREDAEILILGTMPGNDSLSAGMYYTNSSNYFWNFIYRILLTDYPGWKNFDISLSMQERYLLLLENKVALWDVVSDCFREGSLDSKIIDPKFNPIADLIEGSNIKAVLCTSVKTRLYLKQSKEDKKIHVPIEVIGSSSASNWTNPFETLNHWKMIIDKYIS